MKAPLEPPPWTWPAPASSSLVRLEGVSLAYRPGAPPAVAGVSLEVGQGEFLAVVGPSGCGKSSLLKLIAGLERPSAGEVAVAGRPVRRPLENVGMAFQNPTLLPWRNVLENVLLPLEVARSHRSGFRRQRARHVEAARALLETVGLSGAEGKRPFELSGGMQQRVSLCRALVHQPEILLLDEPFAALDAFTREELWGVLQALWLERRPTVVLVTHDLREAVFLADRAVVMAAGPGRVVHERALLDLARPRTVEGSFDPAFVSRTHELRSSVGTARAGGFS